MGQWVIRGIVGEFRYNLVLDADAHNFIVGPRAPHAHPSQHLRPLLHGRSQPELRDLRPVQGRGHHDLQQHARRRRQGSRPPLARAGGSRSATRQFHRQSPQQRLRPLPDAASAAASCPRSGPASPRSGRCRVPPDSATRTTTCSTIRTPPKRSTTPSASRGRPSVPMPASPSTMSRLRVRKTSRCTPRHFKGARCRRSFLRRRRHLACPQG